MWTLGIGRTFALLPVTCIDGRRAWLKWVDWADICEGVFYSPYSTRRYYALPDTDPATLATIRKAQNG